MNRQRDMWVLLALALAIRLLAALPQQQPNYMDAAYSYVNALNLAAGRGFVEDFVWNYLDRPAPPPHPSHLYWMPLTSILAWLGMAVGGVSYRAAQMPFVFLSALLAPISYHTARAVGGSHRQGWLAGLLAIFSGFYFPFWTAIDNFAPFAVAGWLALLLAWQGMARQKAGPRGLWMVAAGAGAGLAHLARADGMLLLVAIGLVAVWPEPGRPRGKGWLALYLLPGYLAVMLPWFVRNWQVAGTFLPPAGTQTIWLAGYDELFSYGRELSARTFLAQGAAQILQGRWWAFTVNLQTVLAVWGMIFLSPLALVGGWHLRRHSLMRLAGLYGVLLAAVMTLVFAFPGARGGLFHSGAAVLPFVYAAAVVGLDQSIGWAAARRRHWDVVLARRVFGAGLVVMAVALSGFIYYRRVIKDNAWNRADLAYSAVAEWVQAQNPTATVMINNPPAYRYHGGGLSVVVPNESPQVMLAAARKYGVTYLVLEPNHPRPLDNLYHRREIPAGVSLVKTLGDIYIFKLEEP